MTAPKQTKQDGEDTKLILYRLDKVEAAVNIVSNKLDNQDNIKRSDLIEFRDTIVARIADVKTDLQKQIDALDNDKASNQEFKDLKKQIGAGAVFVSALTVALFSYLLTRLH